MPTAILKYLNQIKTYLCLLAICPVFILSTAWGQGNLNSIRTAFNQYHQNTIKEKVFVHTDKNIYVTGEIAWFKLYVVDASDNKPLDLSKVAYVEILDSANKQMLRAKIALNNAEGNGSFYLPVNLNSGNYKLRAYTNWMKNFGAEYFFEKDITIVNVQKSIDLPLKKHADKYDIQFFPEGGNLVNKIPSTIAFKGTDEYGKGINFTGFLIDNNDTLLTFKPLHAGMGSFSLTPLPGHVYKALVKTASGDYITKDLPTAYSSGYVMSLLDSADKIKVTVQSDILSGHEIYLFAHTHEIIKVSLGSFLQNGEAVFLFDKGMLGDGISHITIFNEQKQPVCERLYFKKPAKQLEIKLKSDKAEYRTRKKVSINIQTGNTGLKNDSSSLSMSVYLLDSLQSFDAASITSYLLLTSGLKGYIEDPDYYFLNDDPETKTALNNLVLTNGWRRFKWEDIFKNAKPFFEYAPEYNGPIIVGKVINTITGSPASNIESYFSVPGFPAAFKSSFSDKDGRVKFELKDYYGSSEIIVQPNTLRDSIYRIDIADPFSKTYSGNPFPEFTLHKEAAGSLREQSVSMQVQNIYSGKSLKQFSNPVVDSTAFFITTDANYLLDNYTRFITIEEILREYVTLVDVKKREGNFHFSLLDFATNQKFSTDPLVMLDGVPVFNFNRFMQIDPLKLNKLEVLNRKYFLGGSMFTGILSWTSYKGDMADYDPGSHATIIDYDGLQREREFYSPVYTTEVQRSSHLPDFRNVLLWSPDIKIGEGTSKEINFYTSDIPGKYRVVIQGISGSGLAGFETSTFTVDPPSK
jgi:hypothetical protein